MESDFKETLHDNGIRQLDRDTEYGTETLFIFDNHTVRVFKFKETQLHPWSVSLHEGEYVNYGDYRLLVKPARYETAEEARERAKELIEKYK